MQLNILTLIFAYTQNTHRPSKKSHVQLLRRSRKIKQLREIYCLSHLHKPLCSLLIWHFCACPLCVGYFGCLATVLLLRQRPIKSLLSFIHSTFLPLRESNLVLQKVPPVTFIQWSAMETNTKQTGVHVEYN